MSWYTALANLMPGAKTSNKINSDDCRAAIAAWLKGDRDFDGEPWRRKLKFKDDAGCTTRLFSNFEHVRDHEHQLTGVVETWVIVVECAGELKVRIPTAEERVELRRRLHGE